MRLLSGTVAAALIAEVASRGEHMLDGGRLSVGSGREQLCRSACLEQVAQNRFGRNGLIVLSKKDSQARLDCITGHRYSVLVRLWSAVADRRARSDELFLRATSQTRIV